MFSSSELSVERTGLGEEGRGEGDVPKEAVVGRGEVQELEVRARCRGELEEEAGWYRASDDTPDSVGPMVGISETRIVLHTYRYS